MIKTVAATETEIQRAYRDTPVAAAYVDERFASELNLLLHDRQVAVVNTIIEGLGSSRILELAPGPGRVTRDIRTTKSLVCLEYSEAMIQCGLEACNDRVVWVRGNGFQLPFAQVFDFVYSFRFIRHFHREDRERLYAAVRQVLKPGGYFVIDAVNERISKPLREQSPDAYPIYDKLYRLEDLNVELAGAGLAPVQIVPVQRCYRWQYRSQVFWGPRANWLNRLVIRGLDRLPAADGLEWIVTCRRA